MLHMSLRSRENIVCHYVLVSVTVRLCTNLFCWLLWLFGWYTFLCPRLLYAGTGLSQGQYLEKGNTLWWVIHCWYTVHMNVRYKKIKLQIVCACNCAPRYACCVLVGICLCWLLSYFLCACAVLWSGTIVMTLAINVLLWIMIHSKSWIGCSCYSYNWTSKVWFAYMYAFWLCRPIWYQLHEAKEEWHMWKMDS